MPDQLSQGGNGVDAANAEVGGGAANAEVAGGAAANAEVAASAANAEAEGPGAGIAELPQVDQGEGVEGVVGVGGAAPAEGAAPDACRLQMIVPRFMGVPGAASVLRVVRPAAGPSTNLGNPKPCPKQSRLPKQQQQRAQPRRS